MSLHDEYARTTPYELAFRERANAEALVAEVEVEADRRGADPEDPNAFVTMGSVVAYVRAVEGSKASPGSLHQYGALAFHGAHFTRADCPLFLLTVHVARYLVDGAPGPAAEPPTPAGYIQLPQHLFWADSGTGAPESVDGVFWTATKQGVLHTLVATGLRPERPGFAVVPLPGAPLQDAADWIEAPVRKNGGDFSNQMPGAEMDLLYEFTAAGEVLKFLARFFAYVKTVPEALELSALSGIASAHPEPSRLPFTRVTLRNGALPTSSEVP